MQKVAVVLAGTCLFAASMPAAAQDCQAPCISYEVTAELSEDWTFAADPSSLKSSILQPALTTDFSLMPAEILKLDASIVTEPVIDSEPGKNAAFEGIGTYVAEFSGSLLLDPVTLRAGKFDPTFSFANELLPGQKSPDLASAFDAEGRWGIEAALAFEAAGVNNSLALTAFTTDRTILSESLFASRSHLRLSDGGAGNTSGISSFSATISGCKDSDPSDCYEDGAFGYRLGIRHQRAGKATQDQIDEGQAPHAEQAALAAATAKFELGEDLALRLLGETAFINHFEGNADDALQLTASAALDMGQMRYIATFTRQTNLIAAAPDTHDQLFDIEAIYASDEDSPFTGATWSLGAAYTFAQNADKEDAHVLSLKAELVFGGSVAFGH